MGQSRLTQIKAAELQKLLDESSSYSEIIRKFGLVTNGTQLKILKQQIVKYNLSTQTLDRNRHKKQHRSFGSKIPTEQILTKNSNYSRFHLKNRLVKENLRSYQCAICNNDGTWLDKTLTLQLDHINGDNLDNRLENLRFLCPNCHAQTDTFCGKNNKRESKWTCKNCHKQISYGSTYCTSCVKRPTKFEVSKEELEKLVSTMSMVAIGKHFNVSDNAIRKRCKKFGIDFKKKRNGT